MTEDERWDRLLKIRTTGRDDSNADQYRYPYEPTPYPVLERLAGQGLITRKNTLLDYGCGKGRVSFFLSFQTRCRSVGIEYDERIFGSAQANRESAAGGGRTTFFYGRAEDFKVPAEADRIFFFNPFSEEILKKVMGRIRDSWYENPREILLFFYYPSDEYVSFLMTDPDLMFEDEIDCRDLFDGKDPRERILIFSMEGIG
jgi:SAM-dependent methyltransferase